MVLCLTLTLKVFPFKKSEVRAFLIFNEHINMYLHVYEDIVSFFEDGKNNKDFIIYSSKHEKLSILKRGTLDHERNNLTHNIYILFKNYVANFLPAPKSVTFSLSDGEIYYETKGETVLACELLNKASNLFWMCRANDKINISRAYTICDIWEFRDTMIHSTSSSITHHPIDVIAQDFINILPESMCLKDGSNVYDKMDLIKRLSYIEWEITSSFGYYNKYDIKIDKGEGFDEKSKMLLGMMAKYKNVLDFIRKKYKQNVKD